MSELPKGWMRTTVGEVSQAIQYGYTASGLDRESDARMLRITDIQNGIVDWTSVPFCAISPEEAKKFSLMGGDLVFARTGGTVGKSYLIRHAPENAVFASYLIRISVYPAISSVYLYWFFQSLSYWEQIGLKKGGLQGNVNAQMLATVSFNLPPLPEQHRIVAKIEELFSELDASEESLTRARAQLGLYRQSLLKAAFQGTLTADWRAANPDKLETPETLLSRIRKEREERYRQALDDWQTALSEWRAKGEIGDRPPKPRRFEEVPEITENEASELGDLPNGWGWFRPVDLAAPVPHSIGIGPFGSNLKVSDYRAAGVPLVFVKNITRQDFTRDLKFVSQEKADELSAHMAYPDDILITKMGDPPGDCAIYPSAAPPAVITADCLKFRVWEEFLDRKFAAYAITSIQIQRQLGLLVRGVAQKKISVERFKTIALPMPSLTEQQKLSELLDSQTTELDAIETEISTALSKITALRQSILKKAFAGELVPQDPADEPAAALLARIRAEASSQKSRSPQRRKALAHE